MTKAFVSKRVPTPIEIERPVSIGGLANYLGIPRQRIYNLVRRGQIQAEVVAGTQVISPKEAVRVIEAAMRVDTKKGKNRLVFDFV